jgi:hypothetical protein
MATSQSTPISTSKVLESIIKPAFTKQCGCGEVCKPALVILGNILAASHELDQFLEEMLQKITILVAKGQDHAYFTQGTQTLTLPHVTQLPQGAHDKSAADLLADSLIFESFNVSRAADFAVNVTDYDLTKDIVTFGKRQAAVEVGGMLSYINIAAKLSDNVRTGNMNRAMLRLQEAQSAKQSPRTFLLNAPHSSSAPPGSKLSLSTNDLYLYQAIEDANSRKIRQIFLARLGIKYEIGALGIFTYAKTLNPAEMKLMALLNKWPLETNKQKRPARLLEILEQIESDSDYQSLRNTLNKIAFGINSRIEAVAKANAN